MGCEGDQTIRLFFVPDTMLGDLIHQGVGPVTFTLTEEGPLAARNAIGPYGKGPA